MGDNSSESVDQLTCCSQAPLAPTSAPPTTTVPASTETSPATTSRPSDLHGRPAFVGSDLRTHLGSALAELTGCSPSWTRPGTPSGLAWWKLKMPALRTREDAPLFSDAGAMRLKVPTPSAQDYGSNKGGAAGRTGTERPSLRAMLATPLATDPYKHLSAAARRGDSKPTVEVAMKRMLMPTAKDNLTAPSMQKWAGARELMATLASAAEKLPTLTASTGGIEPDGKTGRKLATVLGRRLATPTARDWRSGKASAETLSRNSRPLNEQLCALGITEATALLAIYLWLMAWPRDYVATAYPIAPSKPNSRGGARRSGTRS